VYASSRARVEVDSAVAHRVRVSAPGRRAREEAYTLAGGATVETVVELQRRLPRPSAPPASPAPPTTPAPAKAPAPPAVDPDDVIDAFHPLKGT
jgi:hypothetical protein